MPIRHLHWLPVVMSLCGITAVVSAFSTTKRTRYGMAVHEGHVSAFFPYISNAGRVHPESCIFGQFLNLTAFIGLIIVYVRYKQISELSTSEKLIRLLNVVSLGLAGLCCLGLTMVANFQNNTRCSIPHVVGSAMLYILAFIYCWIQSFISHKINSQFSLTSSCVIYTRFVLAFLSTVLTITAIASNVVAKHSFYSTHDGQSRSRRSLSLQSDLIEYKWGKNDPGFYAHLTSTFCEWFTTTIFMIFILTFCQEFKTITINVTVSRQDKELKDSNCRQNVKYKAINNGQTD